MKSIKITFWLLGFGCGIVLAGGIGTVLSLKTVRQEEHMEKQTSIEQANQPEMVNDSEKQDLESTSEIDEPNETNEIDQDKRLVTSPDVVEIQEDDLASMTNEVVEPEIKKCQIMIPYQISASEVCSILQENGVVVDGEDFLEYIKKQKKQAYIKAGWHELSVGVDYDTLLNELIS